MNIAQSLMAGAGRSDPLMRPGGTAELPRQAVPPGRCAGGGFRFPAMNHWATLRGPSGARHLQNILSGYLFSVPKKNFLNPMENLSCIILIYHLYCLSSKLN
jgi:hypothetical protein